MAQHILRHSLTVPLKAYLDLVLLCRRYGPEFGLVRLVDEARAWRVTFGAKFVLQVADDIWGVRPPASLAAFVPSGRGCEDARNAAVCAALQLNYESRQLTPSLEAYQHASMWRRVRIGLSRALLPPADLRRNYSPVVRRFGLAGGYIWRCVDLIRRHGRAARKAAGAGKAVDADLANYATRQALGAWIRAQEDSASRQS